MISYSIFYEFPEELENMIRIKRFYVWGNSFNQEAKNFNARLFNLKKLTYYITRK